MMNNVIAHFTFDEQPIDVIQLHDMPWWVAPDLSKMLGYRSASDMVRMLDDDQKGTHSVRTLGGTQEVLIVNESGMWNCVFRSKRPEAKAVVRWLSSEVLPSLRRQGFYFMPGKGQPKVRSLGDLLKVGAALKTETNRDMRALLWHEMDAITDSRGLPRCGRAIGYDEADYSQILREFWSAVNGLEEAGVRLNHSRRNHLIALSLPEVRRHFIETGVPLEIDRAMTTALRHSTSPAFVDDKAVNCEDGQNRHCWVFSCA
ncbi:MAG: BRO family protein [Caenibius sp.]